MFALASALDFLRTVQLTLSDSFWCRGSICRGEAHSSLCDVVGALTVRSQVGRALIATHSRPEAGIGSFVPS